MGIDHVVLLECAAKKALGDGDAMQGTLDIIARVKARDQAKMIAELAADQGTPPSEMSVTLAVTRDGEVEEREVSYQELLDQAAPLGAHAAGCEDCPANVLERPYGCVGSVGYPISGDAEKWLMERVAGAGADAHELMFSAIEEFDYDGAPIEELREQGILEGEKPVTLKLGDKTVSSEQILEALLSVGEELDPSHCHMLLVWLGALQLTDVKAENLELGDQPDDLNAFELFAMFVALSTAAENGVPLFIDA